LNYLQKRISREVDTARLRALVRRLGDDSYAVREQASLDLAAAGPAAREPLHDALNDPDREIASRAARCLAQIDKAMDPEVLAAAVRALARAKPQGSAEVLLELVTATDDIGVLQEVAEGLAAVTMRNGQPDPVVLRALADRQAPVRAAAAEALARVGSPALRPAIRKLLHDADIKVRCRVAMALVESREQEAIPALIAMVAEAPSKEAGRIEEALNILAGETAPVTFGEAQRRKRQVCWEGWWRENCATVDLAHLDRPLRPLGFTLLTQIDLHGEGEVMELDAAGRLRWRVGGLHHPIDVQVLANERILVCEYASRMVTERNLQGEILWQKSVTSRLLGARRRPDGRTLLVTPERLFEVDRSGKEVWAMDRPHDVVAACRLRDGQVVILTNAGNCVRYDAKGDLIKSIPIGAVLSIGTQIECLPGGHVLVPLYARNQVVEYDPMGRLVWSAMVARPTSVQRLPNGNTLVASRLSAAVVEIDRQGEEVWHYRASGRPLRAVRR
jgi:hypothetical protein